MDSPFNPVWIHATPFHPICFHIPMADGSPPPMVPIESLYNYIPREECTYTHGRWANGRSMSTPLHPQSFT